MKNLKYILKKLLKSDDFLHDLKSIFHSYFFIRKKNLICSTSIRFINEGSFTCKGIFLLGAFSNKKALDYNSKGCFRIAKTGKVEIGNSVRISRGAKFYISGNLSIGSNTYINPNSTIIVNNSLIIGDNCAISWNCQIIDDDAHTIIIDGIEKERSQKIEIGNHVWIGSNVTILKGAKIDDNSVIAAGSIVTSHIENNVLAGGIPAKEIKRNVNWK